MCCSCNTISAACENTVSMHLCTGGGGPGDRRYELVQLVCQTAAQPRHQDHPQLPASFQVRSSPVGILNMRTARFTVCLGADPCHNRSQPTLTCARGPPPFRRRGSGLPAPPSSCWVAGPDSTACSAYQRRSAQRNARLEAMVAGYSSDGGCSAPSQGMPDGQDQMCPAHLVLCLARKQRRPNPAVKAAVCKPVVNAHAWHRTCSYRGRSRRGDPCRGRTAAPAGRRATARAPVPRRAQLCA